MLKAEKDVHILFPYNYLIRQVFNKSHFYQ